ncbi:hypothetical protein LCGC14_1328670 [marine sediment metagenome]|uniref:Uncharacterized protein n=1 Tax=marine sediment metagenome TaxID=412755 RepID=A0A0F9KH82_9ZZZZ
MLHHTNKRYKLTRIADMPYYEIYIRILDDIDYYESDNINEEQVIDLILEFGKRYKKKNVFITLKQK